MSSTRSDSILLTGMNSGSISKAQRMKEKEAMRKEEKLKEKAVVTPAIGPVLRELEAEKKRVILKLMESVDAQTSDGEFKAITASLNLYKASIDNLKTRLVRIMRMPEPEIKEKTDA